MSTPQASQASAGQDDELQTAQAQGLLPIRDVARITGVNAATLRAWERRYALIVPHRTAKGHRLYSDEHVTRIQAILTWLNRGVSVGQVKGLLRVEPPVLTKATSLWAGERQRLFEAICCLSEHRLDDGFNSALALYPPHTLCKQLLLPLFDMLERRWRDQFGAQAERVFFHSWLRTKLGARLYHNNRQQEGAPLLLINASDLPIEPGLWLTAWLASSAGCPVEVFDWSLPPRELGMAVQYIQPRGLLLYSSQALNSAHLLRLASGYGCPCLVVGPTVHIHRQALQALAEEHADLRVADAPLAALQRLADLNLLNS